MPTMRAVLDDRQAPDSARGQQPLELGDVDVGPDGDDVARHEPVDRRVLEPVTQRLVDVLARDEPDQRAVVDDGQSSVAPARHQLAGLAHRRRRAERRARLRLMTSPARSGGRHLGLERLRAPARATSASVDVPEARRRRLLVASPAEPRHHGADVDLGEPAARDHLHPVGHARRSRSPRDSPGPRRRSATARPAESTYSSAAATPDGDLLPVDVPDLERGGQLRRAARAARGSSVRARNWLTTSMSAPLAMSHAAASAS